MMGKLDEIEWAVDCLSSRMDSMERDEPRADAQTVQVGEHSYTITRLAPGQWEGRGPRGQQTYYGKDVAQLKMRLENAARDAAAKHDAVRH